MTTGSVLYRRWRPQRFADVVGQAPVIQTLRQAVRLGRVAHAYLLCGPRGTGKTSTARILAKALNCRSLAPGAPEAADADGEPDNTCPFCQAVNEGRALDLIEMDAASNRGIDDVRSLQERVFGAGPAEGRCKVYIIDEVHMLTEYAFNALLKTLEEPAPWAYFVLCTTEAHKVPATIISRCQRFDLRRITPRDVEAQLERICEAEGTEWEPEALRAVARAASGSLRDACNILEQTSLSYGNRVTIEGVEGLLGLSRDPRALDLARHALGGALAAGLATISDASAAGLDRQSLHRQVVDHLRSVLLWKSEVAEASDDPPDVQEALRALAAATPWETLLRAVRLFGQVNLRTTDGLSTLPLELALIECVSPPETPVASGADRSAQAPAQPRPAPAPPAARPAAAPPAAGRPAAVPPTAPPPARGPSAMPAPGRAEQASQAPPTPGPAAGPPPNIPPPADGRPLDEEQWSALHQPLKRFRGRKFVLGSLLLDCRSRYVEGSSLVLVFKNPANRDRLEDELEYPPSRQAFDDAVQAALGGPYDLKLLIVDGGGDPSTSQGHLVRAAVAMGARIIPDREENR